MLVNDIMNMNVKTLSPDSRIRDAAIQMCFNKISGMPVVNENNNVVGILSEKDILRAMYPGVHEYMQNENTGFEEMESQYKDVINLFAKDLMTTRIHMVKPDQPVLKAASIMFLHKIRRIPVAVDDKLVGIISIGDVHKAIFAQSLEQNLQSSRHMVETFRQAKIAAQR